MSPLTKLFVVLLVVLSLLTTAATVVYVNKEDVQSSTREALQQRLTAREQEIQTLQQQVASAQSNAQAIQQQANDQNRAATAEANRLQQEISRTQVELAKASGQAAAQQLDISRLTEALNATQAQATAREQEVARLRTANDTLVRQGSDLNASVSDLTARLEVTERERRLLAEQLTSAQGEVQRLGAIVRGSGLNQQQQEAVVNRAGAPPINGVVRAVRPIAGVQYATISVGSADGVQRGMEFRIVDRGTGNFLGTITVDSVEPNESTGRLAGPNVAQIRPGVEVRTQL